MRIRLGYDITYECAQPTPMLLLLRVHPSRESDLLRPDEIVTEPPVQSYLDAFGNLCSRLTAPVGLMRLTADTTIESSPVQDLVVPNAAQVDVRYLPSEHLVYLLGSRYCETDKLSEIAWSLFGLTPFGWPRVQAICDFVHRHIRFGYMQARSTKSAYEVYEEKSGVCRDYAHLAVSFCRCMNIPARYCTGYLGDIGVPKDPAPMDFSAWFEAYLDHRWFTFDARHNRPRIGRVLIGRGRDASDVPLSNTFGMTTGVLDLLTQQILLVAGSSNNTLSLAFLIGFMLSLWTANSGVSALFDALNVVYGEKEKRSLLQFYRRTLAVTLGSVVFCVVALVSVVVLPLLFKLLGLSAYTASFLTILRWPVLLLVVTIGLSVVYRIGPSRNNAKWHWVTWGSVLAAVFWAAASMVFCWYVAAFDSYNRIYGSLGAAVSFMTWIWLSIVVVLLGAELNAEMEHQTAKDTTEGCPKPLGARGANMADHVGKSVSEIS